MLLLLIFIKLSFFFNLLLCNNTKLNIKNYMMHQNYPHHHRNHNQQSENEQHTEQKKNDESIEADIIKTKLLLVSFDGFRHDYIYKYNMKNFIKLLNEASSANYMKVQFPTQTLPNHWSIVTGTHIGTHGIVSNRFYDPVYKEYFNYNTYNNQKHDLKFWNLTEPIWYTCAKQGVRAAAISWPGCHVKYAKTDFYKTLEPNDNPVFESKVQHAIKWFLKDHYNFIALYHNQPDYVSHRYGISSLEFNQTLKELDNNLGYLIDELKKADLYDSIYFQLIVLSSHGMVEIQKNIFLDDHIKLDYKYVNEVSFTTTSLNLQVRNLQNQNLSEYVDSLNKHPQYFNVYTNSTMPDNWHYRSNRVSDILIVANEGINLILKSKVPQEIRQLNLSDSELMNFIKSTHDKANHGYDNELNSMKTIFIAKGSYFKRNYRSSIKIENIDVYPLMCHILNITCNSNNGSFERIRHFLHSIPTLSYLTEDYTSFSSSLIYNNQFSIITFIISIFYFIY